MFRAVLENFEIFIFIAARMSGFVFFNPVLGRRNIPGTARGGISLLLAVFTLVHFPADMPDLDGAGAGSLVIFILLLLKEFSVGFVMGHIVSMFFSLVGLSGEVMDMQMGLAMSNMYDPGSNVQLPLTGGFYNIALMLLFFVTNAHGNLIEIVFESFRIVPVDSFALNPDIGLYIMRLFGLVLTFSFRFAMPVMAAELLTETAVGIIMRAVPQINVFVVGLQMKIIVGVSVMIMSAPAAVWLLDVMLSEMSVRAFEAIALLGYAG